MEERQEGSEVRQICEEVLPGASSLPRIESSVQASSQLCVVRVTGRANIVDCSKDKTFSMLIVWTFLAITTVDGT